MTAAPSFADLDSCLAGASDDTLPVEQVRAAITRFIEPVRGIEHVALRSALGRVLGCAVVSPIDVPAHDNSAMDGYALRAADLSPDGETRLRVAGAARAGAPLAAALSPGESVRIMTGAVLPEGADTIVPQELVRTEDALLLVPPGQQAGQHLRRRGEDLRAGTTALPAGRRLTPADLGLLASLGVAEAPVLRRPRVAFFSTGDELRSIGEPLRAGQVYDSNRYTLWAMLQRLGVDVIDLGVVPDSPSALQTAMNDAANCADAIVSSGGVSVGDADYTRQVMAQLGEVRFWSLAMRPGRPMAFGRIGRACYFGLPGNPVAVMITFYFVVRDALLHLAGAEPRPLPTIAARAVEPIRKRAGRTEYLRACLSTGNDGRAEVRLTGYQGSGVLRSMSEANCIVVLAHERGAVAAGEIVNCVAFEGLI